jgi:hypothetical protein
MLRRIGIIAVLSLIVAALAAVPALAQNPRFVRINASDLGTQLHVTGDIVGLGRGNIDIRLSAVGEGTTTCTNPEDNTVVPDGTPSFSLTSSATGAVTSQGGRATFDLTTPEPPTSGRFVGVEFQVVCPDGWNASLTDVEWHFNRIRGLQAGYDATLRGDEGVG